MNQGKLEVIKQEMARVNIGILGYQWTKNVLEWVNLTQMTINSHLCLHISIPSLEVFGRLDFKRVVITNPVMKDQWITINNLRVNKIILRFGIWRHTEII